MTALPASFNVLTIGLSLLVLGILCVGLFMMARAGQSNWSNRLMRFRVIAQFITLLVIVGGAWFFGK